jgi:proline iminopeptidase
MTGALFPGIEPFATGMLDVGAGHRVYWEQSGNPHGIPVLFCHGGPGSSCGAVHRRFFDPARYRAILFDQRGCGRSEPLGEIRHNTTWDLVADMETLRREFEVERWLLFAGSWGATLALAYAQSHPQAVTGLVLRGVFLGTDEEVDWFLHGLRRFVPEAWSTFARALDAGASSHLLQACIRRLEAGPPAASLNAARAWMAYESEVMALGEQPSASSVAPRDEAVLARVRIQTHYLRHQCFLAERPILGRMAAIRSLPAIVVQGRLDMVCPPVTAHRLVAHWAAAELRMVECAGHLVFNPDLAVALVRALADFSGRLAVEGQ